MTTSDFDKHKVDHLFLLIGENPLPNYVAARLLLENGGTVHLVYTTQTKKRADLLKTELTKLNITVKPLELGDSSADGYKIRNKIKEKIKPLVGRIGLNYTGGTKAMAVHAYQAFVEKIDDLENPVFSYLDSIKLQICIEDINNNKIIPIPSALAICPQPKLEQILGLHDLSWKENKQPVCKSQFPEAAKKIAEFYKKENDNPSLKNWKDWCQVILDRVKDNENGGYRIDNNPESKLKIIEYSKKGKEFTMPLEIQSIFRDSWQIDFIEEIDLQIIQDKHNIKIAQIYEWLDNGWLEDYVMSQVEQVPHDLKIHEIKRSLHIEDPIIKREQDQFEFDVAFLRGYQLFGISCTTSASHKELKQKLFEAYIRAKQLGGDESRVALVSRCTAKDCEELKKELSLVVEDRKIEVFGIDDLEEKRFATKLKLWISRNI
jgi:hypothetical protein